MFHLDRDLFLGTRTPAHNLRFLLISHRLCIPARRHLCCPGLQGDEPQVTQPVVTLRLTVAFRSFARSMTRYHSVDVSIRCSDKLRAH